MKTYTREYIPELYKSLTPTAEINGFPVRPGMFDTNGAFMLPVGINFTVHTQNGTGCTMCIP